MAMSEDAACTQSLQLLDLGALAYDKALNIQRNLQSALIAGSGRPTLIFCQHPSTITIGRRGKTENILVSPRELAERGVQVLETDRGGDVTWHGAGQIVCYPILNLAEKRKDVGWYMRSLEEVIIRTLQGFEIKGFRIQKMTGVWTRTGENGICLTPRKIASLGVRISRWCTLHGFSLNVCNCQEGFALIHPCGFQDIEVTSMEEELMRQGKEFACNAQAIKQALIKHFTEIFEYC